jgi:DNA-binding IclR family transcriptional regulator
MPSATGSSNKAKIARRVIEVLEYFDDDHREATVMDIVRRYNRPQSSTSELLSSLVELGLLYKDPYSRSYSLSPRAALLGTSAQNGMVRDGRLIGLVDRLVAQTGLSVALFGRVCLNLQIVNWRSGARTPSAATRSLFGGMQEPLAQSAIGWLMLSTIEQPRRDGVVRRLIAEAPEERRVPFAELSERVNRCRDAGFAHGPAGFGSSAQAIGVLLPGQPADHPLAIGFVYGAESQVNPESLLECINEAIDHCLGQGDAIPASIEKFPTAA